jgi:hypothetical protein
MPMSLKDLVRMSSPIRLSNSLPIQFLEKNKGMFLFDFQIVFFWVSKNTTKIAEIERRKGSSARSLLFERAVIIMGSIRDQEKAGAGFTYSRNVA